MAKKKIIAVVYSDLHLEKWNKFNEHNRRLKNGLDVLKKVQKVAKINNCPILFAGDLMHKDKSISNFLLQECLPVFKRMWSGKGPTTYAITGNHDQSEENTHNHVSPSYVKTFSQIFPGLVCTDYTSKDTGEFVIHGVPYLTHDLGFDEVVESFKLNKDKPNILMIHTTIPGAHDTDGREINSTLNGKSLKKLFSRFDLVITGHIHKPEEFKIGGTKVIQVGAPQHQRATDSRSDMGYVIIYEDLTYKWVWLDYPKFKYIEEGETIPDTKNFYIVSLKEKESRKDNKVENNFNMSTSKSKLAIAYIKEKRIEDKKKKNALIKALKSTDNG